MAANELVLQFVFPQSPNTDRRTFLVGQIVEGSSESIELYKFHHPNTGTNTGVTSIQRKNTATQRWENAGQIEWTMDSNAFVYFGIERIPMRDLRKMKKTSSKSRRFKANSSEYKWKITDNGNDLICVGSRSKTIATWSHEQSQLRVSDRAESILDRVVVTCFLNIWMKQLGQW